MHHFGSKILRRFFSLILSQFWHVCVVFEVLCCFLGHYASNQLSGCQLFFHVWCIFIIYNVLLSWMRRRIFQVSRCLKQGRNLGGGCPLLNFILWLRTCLLIEAQHILHLDQGHVLSHPFHYKYTCAPLARLPSCAPVLKFQGMKWKYKLE